MSLGDKADVSTNDLLAYWYDDPATEMVALYVESFGNPRRFSWLARALARRKPVLAVKSGRSRGGHRAGASHTAAAVIPDVWVDALFRQAGVIRTDTLGELLDASRALDDQPLAAGSRVAIIGNAGGLNVLAADAAATAGLQVVELSPALQSLLLAGSSHPAGVGNPVDLGADATAESLANAVTTLGRSGEIDSMVITYVATRVSRPASVLTALGSAVDESPSCPVVAVVVGTEPAARLGRRGIPVFHMPEDAVRALGHATDYATWRRAAEIGQRQDLGRVETHLPRNLVPRRCVPGRAGSPLVSQPISSPPTASPSPPADPPGPGDSRAAAEALGYPVAVKSARPDLLHKSDVGGVVLDVQSGEGVRAAYSSIGRALGTDSPVVLVQRVVPDGVELAAGIIHHPVFGSLVQVGAGHLHRRVGRPRLPATPRHRRGLPVNVPQPQSCATDRTPRIVARRH